MLCSVCKVCTSGGLLNLLGVAIIWVWILAVVTVAASHRGGIERESEMKMKWSRNWVDFLQRKVNNNGGTIQTNSFWHLSSQCTAGRLVGKNLFFPNHLLYFNIIICNYFVSFALRDLNQFVYHSEWRENGVLAQFDSYLIWFSCFKSELYNLTSLQHVYARGV